MLENTGGIVNASRNPGYFTPFSCIAFGGAGAGDLRYAAMAFA